MFFKAINLWIYFNNCSEHDLDHLSTTCYDLFRFCCLLTNSSICTYICFVSMLWYTVISFHLECIPSHTYQIHLSQVELGPTQSLPAFPPQGSELHSHLCCLHGWEHFMQYGQYLWRDHKWLNTFNLS